MARWLAVDSSPLSSSVLETLTLLADSLDWRPIHTIDPALDAAEAPEYCLSLAPDSELVLRLLQHRILTYGPRRNCLQIIWLLDPEAAPRTVFNLLTPHIASEWLHDWKRDASPSVPLSRVLDEILQPLADLGYLQRGDFQILKDRSGSLPREVLQIRIESICDKLNRHSYV